MHEALTSAKLIISFAKQTSTVKRYHQAFKRHANAAVKLQTVSSGLPKIFVSMVTIAALITSYIAYIEAVPFSTISVVLISLTRLSPIIGRLIQSKVTIIGFMKHLYLMMV